MSLYGKEIKRIQNCDEITTRCVVCGKEIHLKAGWCDPLNDMGIDEKVCCRHRYAIEYLYDDDILPGEEPRDYDFVIEKED